MGVVKPIKLFGESQDSQSSRHQRLKSRFDSAARHYDKQCQELGWGNQDTLTAEIKRFFRQRTSAHILDVACGTGLASRSFVGPGRTIIGLDISSEMLGIARSQCSHFSDLREFSFDDPLALAGIHPKSIDLLLCAGALHYAQDWRDTLAKFIRVVMHSGLMGVSFVVPQRLEFSAHSTPINPLELERELVRGGFRVLSGTSFVGYFQEGDRDRPVWFQGVVAGHII